MVFGVSVLPQAAPPSADTRLPSQRERMHAHRVSDAGLSYTNARYLIRVWSFQLPPMSRVTENSDVIELKALRSTPYGDTASKMDMAPKAGIPENSDLASGSRTASESDLV